MNNKQLSDYKLPSSAEFDTVPELLWYCNNHEKRIAGWRLTCKIPPIILQNLRLSCQFCQTV